MLKVSNQIIHHQASGRRVEHEINQCLNNVCDVHVGYIFKRIHSLQRLSKGLKEPDE